MLRDRVSDPARYEAAQDAVQQAFLLAWRDLPKLRDVERYDVWLHRLLVNACYEESRRQRRWTSRIRALPVDGPASSDPTVSVDDRDLLERAFPTHAATPRGLRPPPPRRAAGRHDRPGRRRARWHGQVTTPPRDPLDASGDRGRHPPSTQRRSGRHERAPRSGRRSWPRGWMTARRTSRLRRAARSRPPSGRRPRRARASARSRGGPPMSKFLVLAGAAAAVAVAIGAFVIFMPRPAGTVGGPVLPTARRRPWPRDAIPLGVALEPSHRRSRRRRSTCRAPSRTRASTSAAGRDRHRARRRQRHAHGHHDAGPGRPARLVARQHADRLGRDGRDQDRQRRRYRRWAC